MEYTSILAALIAVVCAGVTVASFWITRGKAEEKSAQALTAALTATAQSTLALAKVADLRADIARDYVSVTAMDKVEQRIVSEVHRALDETRAANVDINKRLDEVVRSLIEHWRPAKIS